jgi:catabolite regulation protein CreA
LLSFLLPYLMSLTYTISISTLAADLLSVPWQASVTCALTGKLSFDENAISGKDGQEVFSERCAPPLVCKVCAAC